MDKPEDYMPWSTPNYVIPLIDPSKEEEGGCALNQHLHLKSVPTDLLSAMCDRFRRDIFRIAEQTDPKENE